MATASSHGSIPFTGRAWRLSGAVPAAPESSTSRQASSGPGPRNSQVSRRRSRRGWPGGSSVPGWSASTTGPIRAASASLARRARSSSARESGAGGTPSQPSPRSSRTVIGGRTREAIRRPMYSSSVPAMASGTIVAPVRSAISAAPGRKGPSRPGGPVDRALGHLDEDRACLDDRPRRPDVAFDAEPAAPDRQQAAEAMDQPSRQREVNVDGPLPRNQQRGSGGQRVHRDERVHPAAVRRRDEQVAAPREVLLAGRLDPEAEHAEQHEAGDEAEQPVEQRGARLGLRAEPVEALARAAARGRQRLGAERGRAGAFGRCGLGQSGGRGLGSVGRRRASRVGSSNSSSSSSPVGVRGSSGSPWVAARRPRAPRRRRLPVVRHELRRALPAPEPRGSRPRPATNAAPKIWAVGMSPRRQLPIRRNSSRNRTPPIQMSMIPREVADPEPRPAAAGTARSARPRRADRTATRTGTAGGSGSRRGGRSRTGTRRRGARSRWRCPTAAFVGGPYSSWLKKLPSRPDGLHDEDARGDDVGPAPDRNLW